ncbi:MAG: mandelate racemase/muconate lactonizing protein [Planctomycetota bacterium]|nr:mandelate racemase/muconate lactonizing protein [Planctomycetota bacterium]MDA1141250.1 mandelate racemase/muconate lactonizing protein [Planctomycetota bacterium]
MKITHIEAIPVNVPLKQGLTTKTAHGEHIDSPYVMVRVHTDEEIVGLGEATVAPRWSGETSRGCVVVLEDLIGPALAGEDPCDIQRHRQTMARTIKLNPFAKSAVEMALWDIKGKVAGLPVYQLLGGKVRDEMPIRMVVGAFSMEKARQLGERFLDWGCRCLKVKVGLDPEEDVERVRTIRELAGPEVRISVDANCGWTVYEARRALAKMEQYDILFAEQPLQIGLNEEMAALRMKYNIPIMADESVFTLSDAWDVARSGAADIISIYPGKNGGILDALEIIHVAQAANIACSMGSNLELGIATAAMLHLGAAAPNVQSENFPGDFIGPLYHEADMITKPLSLGPVAARVPEGPGLGVELDMDQVEKYRDRS